VTTEKTISAPMAELYSVEDVHRMGLLLMLQRQGIEDPQAFLNDNVVDYVAAFKQNIGMAITITSIKPRAQSAGKKAASGTDD